ncbi:hypothetical protein NEF87_003348 [Candidatus Lokiarchaeum ossiferum]|uniref:Alpha/beta hydrolase n=1 Tax=Candidatus Lokiarchaeum ossiferum TaxID=2951803 RepID=A0ABY6HU75_9ARCH|nr:hypothetical protein NEF87_003348 [Candidatus Lokiarchaeum sp. B-35]
MQELQLSTKILFEDECEKQYVVMDDGTQLLAMRSIAPKETRNGHTLLMVPGWGTLPLSWKGFIEEARKDFDFIYFETREKASSILPKKAERGGIQRLSTDLAIAIEQLDLDQDKLILVGSCMGANLIADGLAYDKYAPKESFLIGPQPKWPMPFGTRPLTRLGTRFTLTPIRPFLRYWIKKTQSDTPETAAKYIRVIDEASPRKWWYIGKPIARENYLPMYKMLKKSVVLIAEKGDKMHKAKDAQKIAKAVKHAKLITMPSNKATHSELMVYKIRDHLGFSPI